MTYFQNGLRSWWSLVRFIGYFFSLKILFKTLLTGWKRDTSDEMEEWWQRLILRGLFIILGLVIRLIVLLFAILVMVCTIPLLPILLIVPVRFSYENLIKIGSIGKSWSYGSSPTLHKYGKVLYRGPDQKIYGRTETIDLITRVLSREDQDNVLLVGAPGSGRETLVTQFAKNVYRGQVPQKLQNREVIEIPLEGVPVDRLEKMFNEAASAGNIVLVFHDPEKYEGMLNRLEPLLAAPELEIIAITTLDGYHSVWKNQESTMRYFERVEIPALQAADTLAFLKALAQERYKKIRFEEGVFEEIVRRTDELMQQTPQPEKSIKLLENLVVNAKEVAIKDVHHILSQETGVPIGSLERDEKQILLQLEDVLSTEIVGQKEAVTEIASALRRARTGIGSKEKPIGTFLFLGPTGSGKTHTGKMLAKHYFGGDSSMVRFDMSEFATEASASAFIERLAVSIEEQPFGLLFFDELEKADRVIWNTLLQVLDEGRLSTQAGRSVSFRNNIIIATSNAGTPLLEQHPETTKEDLVSYLVREAIFSPEFLNRFDGIIIFHALSQREAESVTKLLLQELNERLMKERGVTVQINDLLVQDLVAIGYNKEQGARALRRVVQDRIENIVAEAILKDQAPPGTEIIVDRLQSVPL